MMDLVLIIDLSSDLFAFVNGLVFAFAVNDELFAVINKLFAFVNELFAFVNQLFAVVLFTARIIVGVLLFFS